MTEMPEAEPGVTRGWLVIYEGPPEPGKPVETHQAAIITYPDGSTSIEVEPEGEPGVITDG